MPKRTDIESILVIGSGPIVIGQACEFDYSGTQACRVLKQEGYKVILVNSNPATIMTDPELADRTYIEPLNLMVLDNVIKKERPDALLPTLGGQTALNLTMELSKAGVLDQYNVKIIGASPDAIQTAEDRQVFKEAMESIGLQVVQSSIASSLQEGLAVAREIGYPIIIRPSYILGGAGTGIANNESEFITLLEHALDVSPIHEAMVEQSIAGWKEFELEVMRDYKDNCVVVCTIENFDPMGVHTGDSITVAPAQTLSDPDYQMMREQAFKCIRKVGVETGGSNIQFAQHPKTGEIKIIEMNPRVSRSSALASKATGFPIAKIAAKLAVGYSLDEIPNDITKKTPACFEPVIDYVVTKIPRWAFEKLPGVGNRLTTKMQSVGEVMAIARSFPESLQKAIRSLERGRNGLNADLAEKKLERLSTEELLEQIQFATPDRVFQLEILLRRGIDVEQLASLSKIDPWFLNEIKKISDARIKLEDLKSISNLSPETIKEIKELGFSDAQIAYILNTSEAEVRALRDSLSLEVVFKTVDTCAAEFEALTPYCYSTYDEQEEIKPTNAQKVIILGSGPNRIGQGIEFDYSCVHAIQSLSDEGFETIMINCNPETVSTDYDVSDRLYFEPITYEDVSNILRLESRVGNLKGIVVSLGGQTPLKLANSLDSKLILGTSVESIDLAEDRARFNELCLKLGLKQPKGFSVNTVYDAIKAADNLGYPVLCRPSYVLGGRAMEIAYSKTDLLTIFESISSMEIQGLEAIPNEKPVLIDQFLEDALEVDVDALRDSNGYILIGGILEHVEEAGIHSGDSACVLPPYSLSKEIQSEIERQSVVLAEALNVVGLINIQFAIKDNQVYVLEVNPRASRTVPFVSKATGYPLAKLASLVMAGKTLKELQETKMLPKDFYSKGKVENLSKGLKYVCVKEAVLPFSRFLEVDTLLGPEMKSTGETMGIDFDFGLAFFKSQLGAGYMLPLVGNVFFSLADKDKLGGLSAAKEFYSMGFGIFATQGTAEFFNANGLTVKEIVKKRVDESDPTSADAVELIKQGRINLVINTPQGRGARADGAYIRKAANELSIPCLTTISAAKAAAKGIRIFKQKGLSVNAIQDLYELN